MKYDLTDEEVDRMVQSNKALHIELASTKVELEKTRKALAADTLKFSPERAQIGTSEAIRMTTATVAVNADKLVPILMKFFGAPTDKHARAALGMVGRVLISLEKLVMDTPVMELNDAETLPPRPGTTRH